MAVDSTHLAVLSYSEGYSRRGTHRPVSSVIQPGHTPGALDRCAQPLELSPGSLPHQGMLGSAWFAQPLTSSLFQRAIKAGGDSRFDEIKKQPRRFTFYWIAQGTWPGFSQELWLIGHSFSHMDHDSWPECLPRQQPPFVA